MKMRAVSTFDQLKELWALTEQCAAQARAAQQQAQRYAQYYKRNAEGFRKLAARSPFPEIQARLLRIADANEVLCNMAEGGHATVPTEGHRVVQKMPKPLHGAAIRRTEDPLSQARRHVAEAEAHIERQEALVAKLSYSSKYLSLADEAREILGMLKQ